MNVFPRIWVIDFVVGGGCLPWRETRTQHDKVHNSKFLQNIQLRASIYAPGGDSKPMSVTGSQRNLGFHCEILDHTTGRKTVTQSSQSQPPRNIWDPQHSITGDVRHPSADVLIRHSIASNVQPPTPDDVIMAQTGHVNAFRRFVTYPAFWPDSRHCQ